MKKEEKFKYEAPLAESFQLNLESGLLAFSTESIPVDDDEYIW